MAQPGGERSQALPLASQRSTVSFALEPNAVRSGSNALTIDLSIDTVELRDYDSVVPSPKRQFYRGSSYGKPNKIEVPLLVHPLLHCRA